MNAGGSAAGDNPDGGPPATGVEAPPAAKSASMVDRALHVSQRVKAGTTEAENWLQRRREHDRRLDYALVALERDRSTGGVVLAGAVAFRLFLFFVPFVVFVLLALGIGSSGSLSGRDMARRLGIGGLVAKAAGDTNHLSGWERITGLVLLAFAVFWAARVLYRVLHVVFSLEWALPVTRVKTTRPALGLIGFVAVCLAAELGFSRLRSLSPLGGPLGAIVFLLLPAVYALVMLHLLPHDPKCPWWRQLPGALLIALGIEAIHLVTVYWVAHQVTAKANLYGGIGSALALLLWAYLMGRIIVLAAVVNVSAWQRFMASRPAVTDAGSPPD